MPLGASAKSQKIVAPGGNSSLFQNSGMTIGVTALVQRHKAEALYSVKLLDFSLR
jgi:hypothetical protein